MQTVLKLITYRTYRYRNLVSHHFPFRPVHSRESIPLRTKRLADKPCSAVNALGLIRGLCPNRQFSLTRLLLHNSSFNLVSAAVFSKIFQSSQIPVKLSQPQLRPQFQSQIPVNTSSGHSFSLKYQSTPAQAIVLVSNTCQPQFRPQFQSKIPANPSSGHSFSLKYQSNPAQAIVLV